MRAQGLGRAPEISRWKAIGAALVGGGAAFLEIGGEGHGRHVGEAGEEWAAPSDEPTPSVERKRQAVRRRGDAVLMAEPTMATEALETERPETPYDAVDFRQMDLSVDRITDLALTDPDAWWEMDDAERSASGRRDENRTARRHLYDALTDEQKETFGEALAHMRVFKEHDRVEVSVGGDFPLSIAISPDAMDGGPAALRVSTSANGTHSESWQYNEAVDRESVEEALAAGVYASVLEAVRKGLDEEDTGDTGMDE